MTIEHGNPFDKQTRGLQQMRMPDTPFPHIPVPAEGLVRQRSQDLVSVAVYAESDIVIEAQAERVFRAVEVDFANGDLPLPNNIEPKQQLVDHLKATITKEAEEKLKNADIKSERDTNVIVDIYKAVLASGNQELIAQIEQIMNSRFDEPPVISGPLEVIASERDTQHVWTFDRILETKFGRGVMAVFGITTAENQIVPRELEKVS